MTGRENPTHHLIRLSKARACLDLAITAFEEAQTFSAGHIDTRLAIELEQATSAIDNLGVAIDTGISGLKLTSQVRSHDS